MSTDPLYDDTFNPSRDDARRRILNEAGVGPRTCWSRPRIWGLIIGLIVAIAAIILIVVLVTIPTNGKNIAQVQRLVSASQSAVEGYQRLGYVVSGSSSFLERL